MGGIKTRQNRREVFHPGSGRGVKTISSNTGASALSINKKEAVHTLMQQKTIGHITLPQKAAGYAAASKRAAGSAAIQKKQADYAIKASRQMAVKSAKMVGNVGGQKFWSWYGFPSREEWCACFVSWCADQCGLIASGAVPKFASCPAGVEWFRSNGKWKDSTHNPSAGTIIFFDWDGDGVSDHVGIVEKCENGRIILSVLCEHALLLEL